MTLRCGIKLRRRYSVVCRVEMSALEKELVSPLQSFIVESCEYFWFQAVGLEFSQPQFQLGELTAKRTMKSKLSVLFIGLALLAGIRETAARTAQFFRIVGPAATTIMALNPDGTLVWNNALSSTNYTVQTVSSLPGGTNWVDYVQLPVTDSVNTNLIFSFNPPAGMALIPAGVFTMGNYLINGSSITNDPDITDAYPTNVYVSAFYMDVNLVSSNQWMEVESYGMTNGYYFSLFRAKAGNDPVDMVYWIDCVRWCNARSQQAGLSPVYYTDAGFTQVYTNRSELVSIYPNWTANGYRLPTEAEWEKAARGGLSGQRFPWGNSISESQANYFGAIGSHTYDLGPNGYNTIGSVGGTSPATSPMGSFAPNGYGLYDMAGNVSEWCWDWYAAPPYPAGSAYLGGTNPTGAGQPVALPSRVWRGGNWFSGASASRCAYRRSSGEGVSYYYIGFRCVKGL